MNASDVINASFRRPDLDAKRDYASKLAADTAHLRCTDTSFPELPKDEDPPKPKPRGRGRPRKS